MKKKYKSIIYLTLTLIILALFFIFFSKSTLQGKFKNDFKNLIWPLIPEKTQTIIKILYDDKYFKRNLNDYNVRFLPRTQSINLDLNVIKIKYLQEDKGIYKNQKKKDIFY